MAGSCGAARQRVDGSKRYSRLWETAARPLDDSKVAAEQSPPAETTARGGARWRRAADARPTWLGRRWRLETAVGHQSEQRR